MGLARRNLCPPTELLRQLLRPHSGHCLLYTSAGHEVAWEELELPWSLPCSSEEKAQGVPSYSLSEKDLVVSGDGFKYVFNRTAGHLTSMVVQDIELL